MRAVAEVHALLFDVFGTVVDWRGDVAREFDGFPRPPCAGRRSGRLRRRGRRRYSPAMEDVRSGRRPFVRLDLLHLENLRATLPEFGIVPSDIPHAELDALNLAGASSTPGRTRFRASRGSSAASSSRPSPTATSA